MNAQIFCIFLISGVVLGDDPQPALLTSYVEKTVQLTERAGERKKELAENNQRALERLAQEGVRRPDPALRLWAERERRVHETTPFCNLSRPGRVTGYPEDLGILSETLRKELTAFHLRLKEEKTKLTEASERDFDARIRTLVRSNDIEDARRERDAFRDFPTHRVMKDLDLEIQRVARLLSGKSHQGLWKRPKNDKTRAPPDALFLFEADNPAFKLFQENVAAVSNGSPHRGSSGASVGTRTHITGRRGLSVLALEGNEPVLRGHYDTYKSRAESLRLVEDIAALPYGAFVVVVAHDDATRRFAGEAQSALFRLGAKTGIADLPYRSAYLLIGVKGLRPGGAVELTHNESLKYPSVARQEN